MTLIDSTKAPIYGIAILPPLSIAIAVLVADLVVVNNVPRIGMWIARAAGGTVILAMVLALPIVTEQALAFDLNRARKSVPYASLGQQIRAVLPADARLIVSDRLWWNLRDHESLSISNIMLQATVNPVGLPNLIESSAGYLVFDDFAYVQIDESPREAKQAAASFLSACTSPVGQFPTADYGWIRVLRVTCRPPIRD